MPPRPPRIHPRLPEKKRGVRGTRRGSLRPETDSPLSETLTRSALQASPPIGAAGDGSQWASSHGRSQPMRRQQAARGKAGRTSSHARGSNPGPRRASSRSWPGQRVFPGIGWRGSVRSADWSPGNGTIPRGWEVAGSGPGSVGSEVASGLVSGLGSQGWCQLGGMPTPGGSEWRQEGIGLA